MDNDGDLDFVVGNLGLNTTLRASVSKPLSLIFGDIDGNGSVDPFIGNYFGEQSFPITGRDETLEQMTGLRKRFTDYKSYASATLDDVLALKPKTKVEKSKIVNLHSGIIWNEKGNFRWENLPLEAQTSPIYAIQVDDFNKDGIKDLLLCGNNANFRIRIGKTDANLGLVMLGSKTKTFKALTQQKTGLNLQNDVRSIVKIKNHYLFGINNGKLRTFKW